MIVLLRNRIMSSWANLRAVPAKKKELTLRYYFSASSDDYASTTLAFLYSLVFTQKSAEPFYAQDTYGYFQPLLKVNPVIHYLKETPTSGTNLYEDLYQVAPVLNQTSFANLKRAIKAMYEFNPETSARIEAFMGNFGVIRQQYDVGLVLEDTNDVSQAMIGLKQLQKRIGKKNLNVFVATNDINLLRQFAMGGDPNWSYMSMMRNNAPTDKNYTLMKTLCEITLLKKIAFLAVKLSSPLGKLVFLTSDLVNTEGQVVSLDNSGWKVL